MRKVLCAIVGTGNIGTDLMYKIEHSDLLELRAMIGIDPTSEGLGMARKKGVESSHEGIQWLQQHPGEVEIVFEATSAKIHATHAPLLKDLGLTAIDLTPASIGPPVIPLVNLDAHLAATNVNMISCGGQATVPIVAAVTQVCSVPYAEIISTVASASAGPGTRQNIDEFTRTTAAALVSLGGSAHGKAIIVLNPASPPILMRNTIYCALPDGIDQDEVASSIHRMVGGVAAYVPGYRLRSEPIFDEGPFETSGGKAASRVTVLLEVEGAGHYLPPYAGNLDIMTAAALKVGEVFAQHQLEVVA